MEPHAVVFDCDGVIVNSVNPYHEAFNTVFEENGLPRISLTKFRNRITGPNPIETCRKVGVPDPEAGGKRFIELARQIPVELFPDALDILDWLKRRSIFSFVASSHPHGELIQIADRLAFSNLVFEVRGGLNPKGKTDFILEILQRFSWNPENLIFVEDNPINLKTAIETKCHVLGIETGFSSADQLRRVVGRENVLRSLTELRHFILSGRMAR